MSHIKHEVSLYVKNDAYKIIMPYALA